MNKSMKTAVNLFSVPWTRKCFPLILNGVLEMVCAQLLSFFSLGTLKVMLYHAVI